LNGLAIKSKKKNIKFFNFRCHQQRQPSQLRLQAAVRERFAEVEAVREAIEVAAVLREAEGAAQAQREAAGAAQALPSMAVPVAAQVVLVAPCTK
jgi:hypothetical protein